MKNHVSAWIAAVGLALALPAAAQNRQDKGMPENPNPNAPGSGHDVFVQDASQREFTVTGQVVRVRGNTMSVRVDDNHVVLHHHVIPFELTGSAAGADVRPGARVSINYHPTGERGQAVDQLQVLEPAHSARHGRSSDQGRAKK